MTESRTSEVPQWFLPLFIITALGINWFVASIRFTRQSGHAPSQHHLVRPTSSRPAEPAIHSPTARQTEPRSVIAPRLATPSSESGRAREEPVTVSAPTPSPKEQFAARYLNAAVDIDAGSVALVVLLDRESGSDAVSAALSERFVEQGVSVTADAFTGEFHADGLADKLFAGSNEIVTRLKETPIQGVVVAKQAVNYVINPQLENLISANARLDIRAIPFGGARKSWSFSAVGAGFTQEQARANADERLVKQIRAATNLSVSSFAAAIN